jgi:hypothetical protein
MRNIIGASVILLTLLSLAWTTWKARRILRSALGRKIRRGEEASITAWMNVPDETLDAASRELARDPFEKVLRVLDEPFGSKEDVVSARPRFL